MPSARPDTPETIVMDMTTTRPEFFRCLEIALQDRTATITGDHIAVVLDEKPLHMTLSALPARALGPTLKLERWQLSLEFRGQSGIEREVFMKKFRQAFHRGGG